MIDVFLVHSQGGRLGACRRVRDKMVGNLLFFCGMLELHGRVFVFSAAMTVPDARPAI